MGGRQWPGRKGGHPRLGMPEVGCGRSLTTGEEASCGGTKKWVLVHMSQGPEFVLLKPLRGGGGVSRYTVVPEEEARPILESLVMYWEGRS